MLSPILYPIIKRTIDISGAASGLILTSPVLLFLAAIIKLTSKGPILYRGNRVGRYGKPFDLLKFRTMVPDAERLGGSATANDDIRLTNVGRKIRKYKLDELPQLWNVLKGDMSLVGPRPTSFDVSTYKLWHTERLEVLPGLTGLWQVSGRSDLDFDERLRLDIEYIERQSLWLDIQILIRTVTVVFTQDGAY